MLKYSIKPNKNIELKDFPIREIFVSPDLTYISGVTDINNGLVNGEKILIRSPYLIGNEINTINVETVKRQGRVNITIKLPIKKITLPLNFQIYSDDNGDSYILAFNKKTIVNDISGDTVVSSITQNYVEYKGDICYFFHGTPSGYLIDHKFYEANDSDEYIELETYTYIENGKMQIGDYTYYADYSKIDSETPPELKLGKNHEPIKKEDLIGLIDGCECYMGDVLDYEPIKWERVDKFYIQKVKNPTFNVDDVLYGGYKHYVTYNDENYYFRDVYQYDKELGEDVYMGYGTVINDMFREALSNYGSNLYKTYHDEPFIGSYLYIGEYEEYLEVHDSLISPINGGRFVILIGADGGSDVSPGNFIIAESNSPISIKRYVEEDSDVVEKNKYIVFGGKKYLVEAHLCDTVNISDEDYVLTYLNEELSSASTVINGETMYFDIDDNKAVLSNKIYYKSSSEEEEIIKVKYGIKEEGYEITESSGVTIGDRKYPVVTESGYTNDGEEITFDTVTLNENIKITLEVTDKNGISTYLAYPVTDDDFIDETSNILLQREYSDVIVSNWKSFNFTLRKDTFGKRPLTVENGLMDSMSSMFPYSISDAYLLENKIELLRMQDYLSFNFPLLNKIGTDIRREDIIKNDFVDYIKKESINTIVDMEKDVYYPVWINNGKYSPIQQIRFNLHFRTRNFDTWKTYEDDREFKGVETPNHLKSNWFVTDLSYYNDMVNQAESAEERRVILSKLHDSSDLLGLMNFTMDEIKNQATKIGKSFLRLSFYSTNDPKTQVLLATSTIFLDESFLYKKYINSKRNSDLTFADVKVMQQSGYETFASYAADAAIGRSDFQVSSNTITDASEVYMDKFFNDDTRLSSRLVVNDKYNTDTSSEGYYIYMFKEYAKKMRESTIYMKVDFNHAGIGQTMSFMLPRTILDNDVDGIGSPLYLYNDNDVKILKNGFNLTDIYKQTHIPIRIIYDEETNKYVYYLPNELRENSRLGIDNEIMEFNLFELKFSNESIVENES